MQFRWSLLVAALSLFGASAAPAATVFSEDFSGATPGYGYVGQVPGAKFTSTGEVDIVGVLNGSFYSCGALNPGGNCMDTIGGRGPGGTITSTAFSLLAGTTYLLSFRDAYSGSVGGSVATYTVTIDGFSRLFSTGADVTDEAFSFTPTASTDNAQLVFNILTSPTSIDNGVVVSNISIDSTAVAGVPETATWAMMLVGFGGVGCAMRGRRKAGVGPLRRWSRR